MKPTIDFFEQIDPAQQVNDVRFEGSFDTAPHSSYSWEKYFSHMVSQGDIAGFEKMLEKYTGSGQMLTVGNLSDDPLRQMQYFTVAAITLICRTAIAAGLDETASYELSDQIIRQADMRRTPDDVAETLLSGIRQYIAAVHEIKEVQTDNPYIRYCLQYIHEHIHEKISLDELAAFLKLNKSYLSRLFKAEMGRTITDYIFERKIEMAKSLLLEDRYTPNEISTFLSFSSQSYFIQIFRRFTGTTPGRWVAEQ